MISSALQIEVVSRLKSNVTAVQGRVYDAPPPGAQLPYISLGPSTSTIDDAECSDGRSEVVQIDVWAHALPNKALAKNIVDQVVGALRNYRIPDNSPLRASPFRVMTFRVIDDPDPTILHGVVQFEVYLQDG
jgi:hypothetical protein